MRSLFASSEVYPLAKTGGLADVSAGLAAALACLGVDIRLIMPGYDRALDIATGKQRAVPLGDILGMGDVALIPARTPDTNLPLWLVDCPSLYRRRGGLYADEGGREWADNGLRFAVLSHAVARLALGVAGAGWQPDLVHANDWHLGLVPALLTMEQGRRPASLLTIHNLAFQGVFPADIFPSLGLPDRMLTPDCMEFFGRLSFLKAGIRFADRLTTVSPCYAREILTPEFGCGLDGLLRTRADDLVGIVNGIDYDSWTPDDPVFVPYPYSAHDLDGKRRCKAALQCEAGLAVDADAPLIAFVSRITEQKMGDVLPAIVPLLETRNAQLAICGDGDRSLEQALRALAAIHPQRVSVRIGYQEPLARRMLAGADMLAAPSRFEPCGLVQMYAMRFGTLPIVRRVGGLVDTVIDHADTAAHGPGPTGFMFRDATAGDLATAIDRACGVYRAPVAWRSMQVRAMQQDFGWKRSAQRYLDLYADLAGVPDRGSDSCMDAWSDLRPTGT